MRHADLDVIILNGEYLLLILSLTTLSPAGVHTGENPDISTSSEPRLTWKLVDSSNTPTALRQLTEEVRSSISIETDLLSGNFTPKQGRWEVGK